MRISINGFSYRSTVAVYGGKYYVPVRKERQEAAGVKAGDTLDSFKSDKLIKEIVEELVPPPISAKFRVL